MNVTKIEFRLQYTDRFITDNKESLFHLTSKYSFDKTEDV